jgi:tRNA dimethylallyltransferase
MVAIWVREEDMERLKLERPLVCIAGPTASGKTAFAMRVAETLSAEIVNADALQVYADIQVLSARPGEADMSQIPHHLFGHVTGDVAYSTGAWLRDILPVLRDIDRRGHSAILAGGTGLYFQALLNGLADIPEVSTEIRQSLDLLSIKALREEAQHVDATAAAKVLGDDPHRLARIVGVYRQTGRPLSYWREQTCPAIEATSLKRLVLMPQRDQLYDKINRRFDLMIEDGALDEARRVHSHHYPNHAPMLKAIGLSHLLSYLDGECDLDSAIEIAKRDTRRLAKRQMTWFRNRCTDWTFLSSQAEKDKFLETL